MWVRLESMLLLITGSSKGRERMYVVVYERDGGLLYTAEIRYEYDQVCTWKISEDVAIEKGKCARAGYAGLRFRQDAASVCTA